jgi:HSP20 family protein
MTRLMCAPDIQNFQREVDQFLTGLFGQPAQRVATTRFFTGADESGYYLEAALPGLDPASLQVRVEDRVLVLGGQHAKHDLPEGGRWHLRERAEGEFTHRLRIPQDADVSGISADYRNGILTLTLPKAESAKPRQIEVRVS